MNNWFGRFQMWLQRVMAGRYGGDQLNWLLLILYLILWAAGMFSGFVLFPILAWLLFFLIVPANVLIFAWAPVKNAHHPLSEGRRRRNRNIARALVILFDLLCAALYVFSPDFLLPMFSLSGAGGGARQLQPKKNEGRKSQA